MLNENAQKWVKALRSGNFKQGVGKLTLTDPKGKGEEHCCLGVATVQYMEENNDIEADTGTFCVVYVDSDTGRGDTMGLPEKVKNWLGLTTSSGKFKTEEGRHLFLTDLNDSGESFEKIADIIESEPDGLFVD